MGVSIRSLPSGLWRSSFKVCGVHNRDEKLMVMEVLLNPPSRKKGKCCVKQVSVQYEVFGNDRIFREVKIG